MAVVRRCHDREVERVWCSWFARAAQHRCISVLREMWHTKRETVVKIKHRLSAIVKLAIAEGYRTDNPLDVASAALPNRRGDAQRSRRQAALPHQQVSNALAIVHDTNAWTGTKLAFRFLVLTAARSGEVRGATWDEIDLARDIWIIPDTRMKAGSEHRVPLSSAAMTVLIEARQIADHTGLLSPSVTGKTMSDATLSKLPKESHVGAVPHGFRSSFRDWAPTRSPTKWRPPTSTLTFSTSDANSCRTGRATSASENTRTVRPNADPHFHDEVSLTRRQDLRRTRLWLVLPVPTPSRCVRRTAATAAHMTAEAANETRDMAENPDDDTRQAVALFRYGLIADLVNLPPGTPGTGTRLRQGRTTRLRHPGTNRTRVAADHPRLGPPLPARRL